MSPTAGHFSHGQYPGRGQQDVPRAVWPPMAAQTQSDRDDPPCHSERAPGLPAPIALRRAGTGRGPKTLATAEDNDEHDRPRVSAPEVIQHKAIVCISWGCMVLAMRPARCMDNARFLTPFVRAVQLRGGTLP